METQIKIFAITAVALTLIALAFAMLGRRHLLYLILAVLAFSPFIISALVAASCRNRGPGSTSLSV